MDTIGFLNAQALGRVGKYGVLLKQQGTDCASFLLNVPKRGKDGAVYITRIPVEIWGRHAPEAKSLFAGQWVHVEGELRRRKRPDDEWEWYLSAFEAVPCGPGVPNGDARQQSLF
jgi:single-stranded DNA-binding protein